MKETSSKKIFFAWPTQTISTSVAAALLGYVTFFATDFMHIPAATVGIIFMISKIFDGFTDVVAGYLIDRTHTKLGKGRPYALAIIGYWVTSALFFCAPEMGVTASSIYIFVMYTLINSIFLTLINCSEPVYLANSLTDQNQSVSILAFTGFISLIFTMVACMILPVLVENMGTTRAGWMKISLMLAIPFTFVGMIRFLVVKERQEIGTAATSISVKDMIHLLGQNKYILIFAVIILLSNIGSNLVNNVQTYFFLYIMNDISLASIMSLSMLAIIVVVILTPALSKKFGFLNVMRATTFLGMVGYLVRLFDITNLGLLFVSNIFAMMGFYTMFSFAGTFVIDCMDYGEWKTGTRSEGTIACAQSVTAKIGTAIGVGLIGVLMGMTGYDGSLSVQPDSANTMIIMLFSVIPASFCLVQLILLKVYDLDKLLPQIREELSARRSDAKK